MSPFFKDLRYAARAFSKAPTAAAVGILALALGIGVNVSAFIAVNGIMLHPLPFAHLDRIQTVWQTSPKLPLDRNRVSPADFLAVESRTSSFESLAACRSLAATLKNGSAAETIRLAQVSPKFFNVLSANAAYGRVLSTESDPVVVVSEAFWKAHLAATPTVIGQHLSLASGAVTIIGVMPDDFDYPLGTDIWSPLLLSPAESQQRATHDLSLIGLLKPGITPKQSAAELSAVSSRLSVAYPDTNSDQIFTVIPLRELTDTITNRFLAVILGAAAFVLLLACANIGNLQLARATNRQKEIAVRAALGATHFQIARYLLAESLLLSTVAGALGVLLADWNNVYTKQNIPGLAMRIVPGLRTMKVDPSVLFFAFLVAIAAGVLCSLPAIFQLTRRAAHGSLDESLRERVAFTSHRSSGFFRNALVVSEIALALVLLIGAGLMVGTFHRLLDLNQGFDPKNMLITRVSLPRSSYPDAPSRLTYFNRALSTLQHLPGVNSAALDSFISPNYFAIEGRPALRSGEPLPDIASVSGSYLDALRIHILEGRAISSADSDQSPRVIVLNKRFAHFYWPNTSPIGQRVQWEKGGEWFTVVGISSDVIDDWFSGEILSVGYVPYTQFVPSSVRFVIRTAQAPLTLASPLRAQLQLLDPSIPLLDLTSMEQSLAEERSGVRAAARTMSSYAMIALLLAVTGIYAVVSYLVSMRTRDIGVHMALGATRGIVLQMMTLQTGKLIFLGVSSGLLLSVLLTRLMAHLLFDVVEPDLYVWFALTCTLLIAAFLAAYLPALRATKIDPISALRQN